MDLAVLAVAVCMLGGCATTIRGTTDVLVVESDPPGAAVNVSNGLTGSTPATFRLRRKGDYVVTISKDGYEPVTVNVLHKVGTAGSAGMAGNLLVGGLIGAAVDAGSGAMFDLVPNPVRVNLVARAVSAAASGTVDPAASSMATQLPTRSLAPRRELTAEDRRAAADTLAEMSRLAQALLRYVEARGALPEGKTIMDIYPAVAAVETIRIADHWGKPFAYGRTSDGFILASAGADGEFDDTEWDKAGDPSDFAGDAVLKVSGGQETFLRKWQP
jgi:hypothetical protein